MNEKTTELVKYTFTREEKEGLADELSRAVNELMGLQDDQKAVAAQFKSQITAKEAGIKSLSEKHRSGYEMRRVDCEVNMDYTAGMVRTFQIDTGELVKERVMTVQERQLELSRA